MTSTFQKTPKKVLMTKQNRINPALEMPLDALTSMLQSQKSAYRQMQCLATVVKILTVQSQVERNVSVEET